MVFLDVPVALLSAVLLLVLYVVVVLYAVVVLLLSPVKSLVANVVVVLLLVFGMINLLFHRPVVKKTIENHRKQLEGNKTK